MKYKVCIIIPIYNVAQYIERCVRSIFLQSFNNIQYIFVNDCTNDNSMEILGKIIEEFASRKKDVTIINHEKNRGLAAARMTGLAQVDAEYVLNIDSDDFVEQNMVELMYNKAVETNADITICDFVMDWGKVKKIAPQIYSSNNEEYTKLLLAGNVLPGVCNKLIRCSLYKDHNIYPVEGINMAEDYATTPRLAYYSKKNAKVDLPLYHYVRTNINSYTVSFSEKSSMNIVDAINVLNDFFTKIPDAAYYNKSLLEGKLRKKISLLMESESKIRRNFANLFPETHNIYSEVNLKIEEQISLFLADKKLFNTLNLYIYIYWNLLEFIQIIKGRRRQ
ncbi:MAG: glycosyltransferase [Paludibacter sp.]|nr:glycosyltransferase [Paludibacter sp.]